MASPASLATPLNELLLLLGGNSAFAPLFGFLIFLSAGKLCRTGAFSASCHDSEVPRCTSDKLPIFSEARVIARGSNRHTNSDDIYSPPPGDQLRTRKNHANICISKKG